MRLVLLGGAPGVGKSTVARAVLAHHRGASADVPLQQWIDVDALWMHQPWRVDQTMRDLVDANLRAVLQHADHAGVDVVLVTWTFHDERLRHVVVRAAPLGTVVRTVQLVADLDTWRERFTADIARPGLDDFYERRYADAQAMPADLVVDTTELDVERTAARVAAATLSREQSD